MTYNLQTMTWPEIRTVAEGGAVALLPAGSCEQHGHHLPTRTDTTLVEAVSQQAAERAGQSIDIAVAPCLWLGASDHHRAFFALSLDERTYIDVAVNLFSSFAEAGFTRLFVLNGHGGNSSPLRVALSLFRRHESQLLVAAADYWSLAAADIRRIRTSAPGGAAHAGEFEMSLMIYLDPELAGKPERAGRPGVKSIRPDLPAEMTVDLVDSGPVGTSLPWRALSDEGQVGDANIATAAKGAGFLEACTSAAAKALIAFAGVRT